MTIDKAINRIKWRIENGGWKSNETDVSAFNRIVDFVLEKKETQLQVNTLFTKVFIMLWINNLEKFDTELTDEIVLKELYKRIDKPMEYHINLLCTKANDLEQMKLFRNLNIELRHEQLISKSNRTKDINKLLLAIGNIDNRKRLFGSYWDYKEVEKGLYKNVFDFLSFYHHK